MSKAKLLDLTDISMEEKLPVWLEIRKGTDRLLTETVLDTFVIIPGHHDMDYMKFQDRKLKVRFYGLLWRCWDSKPTEYQRRAAKWA